ncbi:MAG: response regulator [Sphaerochaetaceae bacterium]|nr:response regulator [Sphaerochaetaceae bacterium]
MRLYDVKISRLINLFFGAVFAIVSLLAANSFISMAALWENTTDLYNHPLAVRKAVSDIRVDVLLIHRDMRQLPFEEKEQDFQMILNTIRLYEAEIDRHMEILDEQYLGPRSDIKNAADALTRWQSIRDETVRLYREGQIEVVEERVKTSGLGGAQADLVLEYLTEISDYAMAKSEEFFQNSYHQRNKIVGQMIVLCISVCFLLFLIGVYLRKTILPPLSKLTEAANSMNSGLLGTRIRSTSSNELGELSRAFDTMATTIQKEIGNKEKAARISSVMFEHSSLEPFCQELLQQLLKMTDSQIGAVYILNQKNGRFERYESIGINHDSPVSFSLTDKEGEFGAALTAKQMQHITDIPSDIEVVFSTVSGELRVKEIITIPIVEETEVVAMISLASIKKYSEDSIQLIQILVNEITASMNAVLASQKVLSFSQELQKTNVELSQQAKELEMQTDELTEQNTELEMQKRQLDEASRLKTNFLSNMSHELRTPLNSVIALSGVLGRKLSGKVPSEEFSYLEIIERNGKQLLMMINDILDISRIEAGREEIEISTFNADTVITEVLSMIQPQALEHNVKLLHESSDDAITVQSDMDKIRHILQNLVGNAVKFTENGTVTVRSKRHQDEMIISIVDTGIGIPEEHLPYIFDEFRQADGSTFRRFGGAGLGLAIAKKYAILLEGDVTVQSSPGIGSEFTLTLPILCGHTSDTHDQSITPLGTRHSIASRQLPDGDLTDKTVLLVDDNGSAIIQIQELVEELGCQVQVAHNAKEAFSLIARTIPDAMVLDLMMPETDGFKVLEILRNAEVTAHVPVLILTAKHITKDELNFLKRNNVHQLIQKGDVRRFDLQQSIMSMIRQKDAVQESGISSDTDCQTPPEKQKVLVVEDNFDNRITVRALLQEEYTVLEATNAQDGVDMARECVPDLILMDIALPDFSGIEAFKRVRDMPQTHHIPVIALTASMMKHDRESILSHGFDAFIGKPIILEEFHSVVEEVLHGK